MISFILMVIYSVWSTLCRMVAVTSVQVVFSIPSLFASQVRRAKLALMAIIVPSVILALVYTVVYSLLYPMLFSDVSSVVYHIRVFSRALFLLWAEPRVRPYFYRVFATFCRAHVYLFSAILFAQFFSFVFVRTFIATWVSFFAFFKAIRMGGAFFFSFTAINAVIHPLYGVYFQIVLNTVSAFLGVYIDLMFTQNPLTWAELAVMLQQDYNLLSRDDFLWVSYAKITNRFSASYVNFFTGPSLRQVVSAFWLCRRDPWYLVHLFWFWRSSRIQWLPGHFTIMPYADARSAIVRAGRDNVLTCDFQFRPTSKADYPEFFVPAVHRWDSHTSIAYIRASDTDVARGNVIHYSEVPYPVMCAYGLGHCCLVYVPIDHQLNGSGEIPLSPRLTMTPEHDLTYRAGFDIAGLHDFQEFNARVARGDDFQEFRAVGDNSNSDFGAVDNGYHLGLDAFDEDDAIRDYLSWCECYGYCFPRRSFPFRVAESVLYCLSALFGCGLNEEPYMQPHPAFYGDRDVQWRPVSDPVVPSSTAGEAPTWHSELRTILTGVVDLVGGADDESIRLTSYLVSLTQQSTPLGAASVTLATYPSVVRHASRYAHSSGLKSYDLLVAMFAGDSPVEGEYVAVGDSNFHGLLSAMRQEFVVKLVLGDVFSSVVSNICPSLTTWLRRYISAGTSLMGFVASIVASCHRVYAHIRYYIDGDMVGYLGRLDSMSAFVFRHGLLHDEIVQSGYTAALMPKLDDELRKAKQLLLKLAKTDPDFAIVNGLHGDLVTWRQQCAARLAGGDLPFCLLIVGPTRCGKSEFTENELPCIVAARLRLLKENLSVARPRSSDAYDTELKPVTHLAIYQDPSRDAILEYRRQGLNQLFEIAAGQPIAMTRAAVDEKGLYMAPPACIALTANLPSMRVDDGKIFVNHEALAARLGYGAWVTWDGDEVTDPNRERVAWNLGKFSPSLYAKCNVVPYDATAPHCGLNMTRTEFARRVSVLFNEHHDRNALYARARKENCLQCPDCYALVSLCYCVKQEPVIMSPTSDPVTLVVSLPFSLQLLLYSFAIVPLVGIFIRLLWNVAYLFGLSRLTDWLCVTASTTTVPVIRAGCASVQDLADYVRTVPKTVTTVAQQYARLAFLRAHAERIKLGACVAFVVVCGAAYWAWAKKRSGTPFDGDAVAAPLDFGFPSTLPFPGEPVSSGEEMAVEERCVRIELRGKSRMCGFVIDDRTIAAPGHFLGKRSLSPGSVSVTRPGFAKVFTLYPEAVSRPLSGEDVALMLTNQRLAVSTKPFEYRRLPMDFDGVLYLSGRSTDGTLLRKKLEPPYARASVVHYVDQVTFKGEEWTLAREDHILVPFPCPNGTCGFVLHDGHFVYGHVVAAGAHNTAVLLYKPVGEFPFCVKHCDVPVMPLGDQDPVHFMEVRGCASVDRHTRSMFQYSRVASHWDYRGTVEDHATPKPRRVRCEGPDVRAFEVLSGIPASSLSESTGAPGIVSGKTYRVSPMEHMFENHLRAQSLPSPILDGDSLLDVKAFVDELIDTAQLPYQGPLSTDVAVNGDGVIAGMALDKSAGFPECAKRDLMVSEETGRLRPSVGLYARVEQRFHEFVKTGVAPPPVFKPFPKQGEILPSDKVAEGRARIIMNMLDLVHSIVVRRVMLPILLNIVSNRESFGILVGLSATNPLHVAALASVVHFGDPSYHSLGGDHSKLDLHQRFRVALIVMTIYIRFARRMQYSDELVSCVKRIAASWLFPNFIYRGDIWTSRGDIWGSGTLGTDVFQSLTTWLLHVVSTALFERRSDKLAPIEDVVDRMLARHKEDGIRVYGDDNIRNVRVDVPWISGAFIAEVTLGCGYEMTDAVDKTKPPAPTESVSILKRTIKQVEYDGERLLTMPLEIKSIVKSIYLPKKGPDGQYDPQIYAACIRNANRELFLHGPEVHAKWYPVLLTVFSRSADQGSLETPLDLLASYRSGSFSTWDSGGQLPL